jgi:peptidylprolyl isomerase
VSRLPAANLLRLTSVLVLALGVLSACGDEAESGEDAVRGLSSVTVTGDFGASPEVEWDGRLNVTEIESEVLIEGDGPEIKEGDQVLTHLWIGNGFSQSVAYDSFANQAQPVPVTKDTTKPLLAALEGRPTGSRVLVAATAKDAFGEQGNPQLGIGNRDSVLFVVDAVDIIRDKPSGTETKLPAGLPSLIEKDGVITGWDFRSAAAPDGELQVVPLITGDGPKVTKDSTIVTRYLGQVYKAKKPFDEAYSKAEPATFNISGLVKGWQQGLVGVPAGSRIVIVVPPALGYGKAGNEGAGIKGTDTLYFVLDVLATS